MFKHEILNDINSACSEIASEAKNISKASETIVAATKTVTSSLQKFLSTSVIPLNCESCAFHECTSAELRAKGIMALTSTVSTAKESNSVYAVSAINSDTLARYVSLDPVVTNTFITDILASVSSQLPPPQLMISPLSTLNSSLKQNILSLIESHLSLGVINQNSKQNIFSLNPSNCNASLALAIENSVLPASVPFSSSVESPSIAFQKPQHLLHEDLKAGSSSLFSRVSQTGTTPTADKVEKSLDVLLNTYRNSTEVHKNDDNASFKKVQNSYMSESLMKTSVCSTANNKLLVNPSIPLNANLSSVSQVNSGASTSKVTNIIDNRIEKRNVSDHDGKVEQKKFKGNQSGSVKQSQDSTNKTAVCPSSGANKVSAGQVKSIKKKCKKQRIKKFKYKMSSEFCVYCFCKPKNTIFKCGHRLACVSCARCAMRCPACEEPVEFKQINNY